MKVREVEDEQWAGFMLLDEEDRWRKVFDFMRSHGVEMRW